MAVKPGLPKGTRDFLPESMQKRDFITSVIKEIFLKYGFQPIETPAMENLSTLTGKYGEEGDRLIFKILNSGDYLSKADEKAYKAGDSNSFTPSISDKALRYDLTVPFARFVVQNQNDLTFPFKRYQVQPVWRADRPQKGRYREFYQCDADAVGSGSLLLEMEFMHIYDEVFKKLELPVTIHVNNRKLLAGVAAALGIENRLAEFTVILDKLDKIGMEGVRQELAKKGFKEGVGNALEKILAISGNNEECLNSFKELVKDGKEGLKGIEELSFLLKGVESSALHNEWKIDISLARGLDYYTGAIFEVKARGVELGSVGGGGRYDDLTGVFGMKGLSGVGISFGLDRIQLAMEELGLFPEMVTGGTEVMFVNFGEQEALYSMDVARSLRDLGVKTEVYPDSVKIKKQMDYANKKNIAYVVMIGSEEMESGKYSLRNMMNGEQSELGKIELLELFSTQNKSTYGRH